MGSLFITLACPGRWEDRGLVEDLFCNEYLSAQRRSHGMSICLRAVALRILLFRVK
jgi:hypothetical protein